jgi:hypothetical protein
MESVNLDDLEQQLRQSDDVEQTLNELATKDIGNASYTSSLDLWEEIYQGDSIRVILRRAQEGAEVLPFCCQPTQDY